MTTAKPLNVINSSSTVAVPKVPTLNIIKARINSIQIMDGFCERSKQSTFTKVIERPLPVNLNLKLDTERIPPT